MSRVSTLADEILVWHEVSGSPLPGYMNSGLSESELRDRLISVGLKSGHGVRQLYDLYEWRNGVDRERWNTADMKWYPELWPTAVFMDHETALATYDANLAQARSISSEIPGSSPDEFWPEHFYPVFSFGPDSYAIDCSVSSCAVWLWMWTPTTADPNRKIAESLLDLLGVVQARFESGAYVWDSADQRIESDWDQLPDQHWPL